MLSFFREWPRIFRSHFRFARSIQFVAAKSRCGICAQCASPRLSLGIRNTTMHRSARHQREAHALGRFNDRHGSRDGSRERTRQRQLSLDATGDRRRRDGDDRQLSIWLDVLRPRHPEEIRMGSRLDPVGVHAVRAVRDLAGAGRRLVRRQIRSAPRRSRRRHPLRDRMGDQREGDDAQRLLSRHDRRRHRRRRRLRHLRRQRAEMVSRQARPRRRHHRGRIRRGLGADGRADPGDDQGFRLPDHVSLFRPRTGHHHRDPRLLPVRAEGGTGPRRDPECAT